MLSLIIHNNQNKIAMSSISQFKSLHQQSEPLLLGNVWNAHTAKLAEKAGYKALGSSSHAMAFALGYEDGQRIPVESIFYGVERILAVVNIPVSVDFEAGYADDPKEVARNVKRLADLGVAGINLEDGIVRNGKRELEDAGKLAEKIKAIKTETDIFINARADTYTTKHPQALEESIRRATLYAASGADGIFVPLIESETDIKAFTSSITLPLNVFTTPGLPAYDKLADLGVKRISHGAKQYDQLMKISEGIYAAFIKTKEYTVVLGK